ncbi:hypothetical protein Sjap_023183 [Stephania japonica]|uniref:U5 small nuclear ribonucleoprotein TSSC4 n=1 Tax=Stephania japonica TaxID=461633 RepID=A0AAP0EB51_9MAGN
MDDTFKARVDKIFGSLSNTPQSSLRTLWSLTDEEVEKREWNRESSVPDRDENPCSSSFDGFLAKERRASSEKKSRGFRGGFEEDLSGGDNDDDGGDGGDEEERDEWDVRASIGLDRTLDNEIFGSLSNTPQSSLCTLWSLIDEEVEKREWNRESSIPN